MGSKLTLKNSSNVELSIEHSDLLTKGKKVTYVDTIEQLEQLGGLNDYICIVTDKDRGGIFIYDSSKSTENDGGIVFNGWIRQYNGAVNVKWFGAKEGEDITNIINSHNDKELVGYGSYIISDTIVLNNSFDFSSMTLHTDLDTIGIQVGDYDSITQNKTFKLPILIKNNIDHSVNSIGVKFVNLYNCSVYVRKIDNFTTNMKVTAKNAHGNVYNVYNIERLGNGKINLLLEVETEDAWVNENTFTYGRLYQSSSLGTEVSGYRQVKLSKNPNNIINNNLFIKLSLEGNVSEYIVENSGQSNTFLQCRWESDNPKILYSADNSDQATRNSIIGGYRSQSISITNEGTSGFYNSIVLNGTYNSYRLSSSKPIIRASNVASSNYPIIGLYPSTVDPSVDGTNPTVEIGSNFIRGKLLTDTDSRLKLDFNYGYLYFGNGAGSFNYIRQDSVDVLKTNATFRPNATETLNLGTNSYKWAAIYTKDIFADLPTSDPGVDGQLWNDSGTVKVSAG